MGTQPEVLVRTPEKAQPEVLVLTPEAAQLEDLEERLGELSQVLELLPARILRETPPPAPRPEREAQLRAWAD